MSLDTTALESEISELEAEINIAAELIEECIKENAHVASIRPNTRNGTTLWWFGSVR